MTTIAARLVPVASRSPYASQKIRSGTMIVPPPTPNSPLKTPPAVPIARSFRNRSRATGGDTSGHEAGDSQRRVSHAPGSTARIEELLASFRAAPGASALLCDIDGTLAPIVPDPEDAAVPDETRDILRRLASSYRLVACVTGRRALEARRIVGVDELVYSGNHGLEFLPPGAAHPELDPAVTDDARRTRDFVLDLDATEMSAAGIRLENKGPIQALHWRGVEDEAQAQRQARRIASSARAAGLAPHWGRKVLEVRPVAAIDKGTAVERVLSEHAVELALFGGDDRGDVDAFAALDRMVESGRLRVVARVGVISEEAPPELGERADTVVEGTAGFLELLRTLANPAPGVPGD